VGYKDGDTVMIMMMMINNDDNDDDNDDEDDDDNVYLRLQRVKGFHNLLLLVWLFYLLMPYWLYSMFHM
jgi:hypothetical protein